MKRLGILLSLSVLAFMSPVRGANPSSESGGTGAYEIYLKAVLYETQGNLLSARAEIEKALKLEPESIHLNFKRAELSFFLGQLAEAKQAVDQALSLEPNNPQTLILAGQIYWALGDPDRAETHLEKAVDLSPDEIEPLVTLVLAVTPRDPEKAIRLYKDFLKRHPSSSEIHERLAQLYRSQNKIEKAKESWNNSLEYDPASVRAHLALAQLAEVDADTMTAIGHYKEVLARDTDNLPLLLRVGELQYRNNEMAEAYQAFSHAQKIAPESPSANFWMALLHEHKGEWAEAAALLENIMENSLEPGVLLRLSYYYTQMGEHKKAIELLEKLTEEEPENTDFYNYLAIAYEHVGKYSDAAKTMEKLVDLDPQNHEYLFYLGTLYDRLGKFSQTEKTLKKAIKLDPQFHLALNYLGYSYADRGEKLDEGEQLLIRALDLAPDKPAYLDSLGWIYFKKGKFDDAVMFLKRSADLEADPLIWDHLGQAYEKNGNDKAAVLAWDESLRLKPDQKTVRKKNASVLKNLPPSQQAEVFLDRSQRNFLPWMEIQSLTSIKVCEGIKCVSANGQFSFIRGNALRIEIPGPLSGPVLLVVKKEKGPVEYGALHPQFQTAETWVKKAIEKISLALSGALTEEKKGEAVKRGGDLYLESGKTSLVFDGKTGFLSEAVWQDGKDDEILKFDNYPESFAGGLPAKWTWRDKKANLSLSLELQKPVFNKNLEVEPK